MIPRHDALVDNRRTASGADPAIREPAHGKRAQGIEKIGPGRAWDYRAHGKAARFHQIERQPRDNEVVAVVRGKVPDRRTPQFAASKNLREGRLRISGGLGRRRGRRAGPYATPWHEPNER